METTYFFAAADRPPTSTTALLLPPPRSPTSKLPIILFTVLLLTSTFIFSSSSSSPVGPTTTTLKRLARPTVILISSDGFRYGYQFKSHLPNIHRLIANGTEAVPGLIPVFPTLTFPNHYSIVTGLYPASHGIINNRFDDPNSGETFTMRSHEPKWWLGEPLWETAANHGLPAATYFWPGSEVPKGRWHCPPNFCEKYNGSIPFKKRVDSILNYFDLPPNQIPVFLTLYFEDPDHQGHEVGPDDPEITSAVTNIDRMIGRLIRGLEKRSILEEVTVILVGDHGMAGICDKKLVFLEDLSPWIEIAPEWIQSYSPVLAIRPPPTKPATLVVEKMNSALNSGKVENGEKLRMYLKEDLPKRLHYSESYRIPPIVGILEEGYMVEMKRSEGRNCGGAHGYDNAIFSMRSIFVGHGPRFGRGRKVESFENVQIYNLIAEILQIKGAANNGSDSFPRTVLLPVD